MDRPARTKPDLAVAAATSGVALIALMAGIDGSPLHPILPFGVGPLLPFRAAARGAGLDSIKPVFQATVAILAVVGATLLFLYALREAWRGNVSVGMVAGLGIAFVALSVALPLLFSRDVYSYSMYGRIASLHHSNPYVSTPQDFSHDPFFALVGPQWRDTTAVYGPAFTLLSSVLTRWLDGPVALIWAFKAIAGAAAVGTIVLVASVTRRLWPSRAAFATALIAWNPVFLFHGVGGGHNDLLVGLAVAAAMALLARRREAGAVSDGADHATGLGRELAATAVLALAMLIKATAAIPLLLVVVTSAWRRPSGERARVLGAHIGIVAALSAAFAVPFLQTSDPSFGLATLATHEGWLAPSRFFRVILGSLGHAVAGDPGQAVLEGVVRVVFPAVFVVVLVFVVRWVAANAPSLGPKGEGAAWGWTLLVATLCAPVLLPWYIVWTLPVVWLLPQTARGAAIVVSAVLTVSQTIAAAVHFPTIFHATLFVGHYILTPVLFVTLIVLLRDLRHRLREGAGLVQEATPPPAEHREVAAAGNYR